MELASVVRACAVASLGMMTSAGALIVLGEGGTVWAVASALLALVACASVFSVAITFGATKEQLALV